MDEEPTLERNRTPVLLVVSIVAAGLVGFGLGSLISGNDDTESRIPAAVQTAQQEWFAAWNAADGDAVVSMMVPEGHHYCPGTGTDGASGDELADFVATGVRIEDIETVGVVQASAEGDTAGTGEDYVLVTRHSVDGHDGYLSVLHLRGPEDSLRVVTNRAFP